MRRAALLLVLLTSACSDGTSPEPAPPPVGAVALSAASTELAPGETVQVVATVLDTSGVLLPGRSVTWSSSDAAVVTVTSGGLVTAVGAGFATVTATSGGVSGELSMSVLLGPCRAEVTRPTTPGQTHDATLMPFDCVLLEGPIADGWQLTVTEPTGILITMTSSDFDALLLVTDPGLNFAVAFDDDGAGGTDARLFHHFDPGTYLVWATSLTPEAMGSYRLTSEVVQVASCDAPVGAVGLNETVTGSLAFTSCVRNGAISDPWSLSLSEGERIGIALASSEFDTVVEVTDATGRTVAFDDDGGVGTNSLIVRSFPAGDYTVWVTSYGGGRTGSYSLAVNVRPPQAQVLLVQPPEPVGINYAAPHYADDFTLGEGARIGEFLWWGSVGVGVTTAIRLFTDDGTGAPAVDPFFEVLSPVIQSTATSVVPRGPGPVYLNRTTLADAPVLEAGVRYYVSISGPDTWLSSTAPGSEWWWRPQDSEPWRNASDTNPNNLAFELIGVPAGPAAPRAAAAGKLSPRGPWPLDPEGLRLGGPPVP